jgi:CheY-specific phosphatase CheX
MPNNNQPPKGTETSDLRAKYKLPPLPPNVQKIAGLVKGRSSASMDEITDIINTDSGVTQRLITLAYPKPSARQGTTIQMATARLGVNRVIVVMVGDLLTKAVIETFETMAEMTMDVVDASSLMPADHGYLTGTVRFTGPTSGKVSLAFSPFLSMMIAAKIMGGGLDDEQSAESINDAIGELVNIVTGNLQSKLSDAGLASEVTLPEVKFESVLTRETNQGASSDEFFFKCGTHTLIAHLSVDPSAQAITRPPARAPLTKGNTWRANGV